MIESVAVATATPQGANEFASVLGRFVSFSLELE